MNKLYNYFYKITNNLNGHFYYGVHSTDDLEDGYMGSGVRLHYAYKQYGIENFTKEILKFFDSKEEAYKYEAEIVNEELVKDENCYNLAFGGQGGEKNHNDSMKGKLTVKNKNSKEFYVINASEYDPNIHDTTWTNRHHSKKSKDKIRKTMTKSGSVGKRVWINKDGIVKYLRKELLEKYLNDGWDLGRTGYKPRKNGQGKVL